MRTFHIVAMILLRGGVSVSTESPVFYSRLLAGSSSFHSVTFLCQPYVTYVTTAKSLHHRQFPVTSTAVFKALTPLIEFASFVQISGSISPGCHEIRPSPSVRSPFSRGLHHGVGFSTRQTDPSTHPRVSSLRKCEANFVMYYPLLCPVHVL